MSRERIPEIEQLQLRRDENFELYRRFINPAEVDLLGLVGFGRRFVSAEGTELEDEHGERYLDFLSGYGALNVGHNHPSIKAALEAVLAENIPSFSQIECGLPAGLAAEKLASLLPDGLDKVFFCSSGSEAVEAALKVARAATKKKRLIGCERAYHGTTCGALGLMGNARLRDPFRPLIPGMSSVPFGDLEALRTVLRWKDVAAFVVEPVLGEGGAVVAPSGYLREAQTLCHRHGALFVVDEVQTGLGRTGRMFAFEEAGITPDVITLSKSLGGGLVPVGATIVRDRVFQKAYGTMASCLDHTTTFGGGPLAMTAVLATLRVLEEESLVENARRQGSYLESRLRELAERHRTIREVRGVGLMLGLRVGDIARGLLDKTLLASFGRASAELFAQYLALRLMDEHHIVTQVAGNDLTVLKVMPPLAVTRENIDRFVGALDTVLSEGGHRTAMLELAKELIKHQVVAPER